MQADHLAAEYQTEGLRLQQQLRTYTVEHDRLHDDMIRYINKFVRNLEDAALSFLFFGLQGNCAPFARWQRCCFVLFVSIQIQKLLIYQEHLHCQLLSSCLPCVTLRRQSVLVSFIKLYS